MRAETVDWKGIEVFGRRKQEEPQEPRGRYHVEAVHTMKTHEALAASIAERLNAGDAQGWRLVAVTQHAATVLLYWDTQGGG